MKCIVNTTLDWGIGNENRLLVNIPEDMKWFREHTKGKAVIMGRKTLESFPGGRPLKNRVNIVVSRNPGYEPHYLSEEYEEKPGDSTELFILNSVDEVLELVSDMTGSSLLPEEIGEDDEPVTEDDFYVIGGASIYRQFMPYVDTAYVTRTLTELPADTYFPNLDEDEEWECIWRSEEKEHEGVRYFFAEYRRKNI